MLYCCSTGNRICIALLLRTECCIVVGVGTEYCIVVVLGRKCCICVVLGMEGCTRNERLYCCSTGNGRLY